MQSADPIGEVPTAKSVLKHQTDWVCRGPALGYPSSRWGVRRFAPSQSPQYGKCL